MKREFTVNITLLFLINFVIKPIYIFGIDARIQNLVGPENYGVYFDYFNFVLLFQFINDPGIQNWNAQFVPKHREQAGIHFSGLIKAKSIFAGAYLCIVVLMSYLFSYTDTKMIMWLCINVILSTVFLIIRGTIAGLGHYKIDSLMSALDKTLMIFILGYLCWISNYQHDFDIYLLIYGQSVSYFLAILISGGFLVQKIGWDVSKFDGIKIIQVIKDSSPFVLILIFMTAYNKLDGVMLGRLLDDNHYQAGVYASAYRFYEAANMVGYLFAALLLPMFAANMQNHKMLSELKSIGLRFVILSSMLIVWSIYFYGEYFLKLLYDGYESGYLYTLYFLIFSYLMVAIAYIYGTLIVATGHVRNFNILLGLGLIVNIIFNLILIPTHFAIGAAVATLITQTFVTIGQVWLVKRDLKITISRFDLQQALLFCISSGLVFYLTSHLYSLSWMINLTLSILICLLLSFILKIVNKEEVMSLLKRKI